MDKNPVILAELEQGLAQLEEKLNSIEDNELKLLITERARNQLKKAQLSSLVKGTILVIDLIENRKGQAWSVLHDDNGEQQVKLYYFSKHAS